MNLELVDEAIDEVVQAARFYNTQRLGLGLDFLDDLAEGYAKIEAHPNRYPRVILRGVGRNTHFLLLDRFPYQVIYQIEATRILVVAVAHTSRRTGYWRMRGG